MIQFTKRMLLSVILCAGWTFLLAADCCKPDFCCGHSFFRGRPVSQDAALELSLHRFAHAYQPENDACLRVEASAFYFRSRRPSRIAEFFLPNCSNCITIAESNVAASAGQATQISSPWIGLQGSAIAPFNGQLCLCPRRTVAGAALKFDVSLSSWMEECGCKLTDLWLSVFVPVVQVKHDLRASQTITNPGNRTGLSTILDAFNNPAWKFGRISRCSLQHSGIDDIKIKLGATLIDNECKRVDVYGVVYAPTGRRSHADYLFEPTIGSGRHLGAGAGLHIDYALWSSDEGNALSIFADVQYAYFMRSREVRSLDLVNGPWSRYLQIAHLDGLLVSRPGINFFTRDVDVTPRGMVDALVALDYDFCNWNVEIGYEFWWRQNERVELRNVCEQTSAIYDITGRGGSLSNACICAAVPGANGPVPDLVTNPISQERYNENSAAMPRSRSHKVFGALGYDFTVCENAALVGVGFSYEFGHCRSALSQWGVWAKAGLSF